MSSETGGAGGTGTGGIGTGGGAGTTTGGVGGMTFFGDYPEPPRCEGWGEDAVLVSGALDARPFKLDGTARFHAEVSPLTGSPFSSLLTFERGTSALSRREGGIVLTTANGFWDVTWDEEPQWHPPPAEQLSLVRTFLHGDLDADGDDDAVSFSAWYVSEEESPQAAEIWERTPDGLALRSTLSLEPASATAPSPIYYNREVRAEVHALADVEGDGDLDVITFRAGAPHVYRTDGGLELNEPEAVAAADTALDDHFVLAVDVADRNGDSSLDLVAILAREEPLELRTLVFFGDGAGSFELSSSTASALVLPTRGLFGDIDGDGRRDLLLERFTSNEDLIFFVPGAADGTFEDAQPIDFGPTGIYQLQLIDLDGDGTSEVVHGNPYELVVERMTGEGTFESTKLSLGGSTLFADMLVEAATAETPARLHAFLYRGCPAPCSESEGCDGRCIVDQCVAQCLTDADCPGQICWTTACVDEVPEEASAR